MHVFISRALQKVLKEAPKKHTALRQACQTAIDELKERGAEASFPVAEVSTDSPPSTPLPKEPSPRDQAGIDKAQEMLDSSKCAPLPTRWAPWGHARGGRSRPPRCVLPA